MSTWTQMHPLAGTVLGCTLAVALAVTPDDDAEAQTTTPRLGIAGRPAPELDADVWFNLGDDATPPRLAELRGRVVYLFFFQSWCPGCHSHGFPTLQEMYARFEDDPDVVFIAVQTVFEGHGTNTAARARETVADYALSIPVAHDSDEAGEGPSLMRRYRSGGTPWTVLIDRDGIVRFNGFQLRPESAVEMIERLLGSPTARPKTSR